MTAFQRPTVFFIFLIAHTQNITIFLQRTKSFASVHHLGVCPKKCSLENCNWCEERGCYFDAACTTSRSTTQSKTIRICVWISEALASFSWEIHHSSQQQKTVILCGYSDCSKYIFKHGIERAVTIFFRIHFVFLADMSSPATLSIRDVINDNGSKIIEIFENSQKKNEALKKKIAEKVEGDLPEKKNVADEVGIFDATIVEKKWILLMGCDYKNDKTVFFAIDQIKKKKKLCWYTQWALNKMKFWWESVPLVFICSTWYRFVDSLPHSTFIVKTQWRSLFLLVNGS